MPTNTRVWRLIEPPEGAALTTTQGDEVVLSFSQIVTGGGCALHVGTPRAPLQPNTQYALWDGTSFTTGEGEDHNAPDVPEVTQSIGVALPDSCGSGVFRAAELTVHSNGVVNVVDAEGESLLDVTALAGNVTELGGNGRIDVGVWSCGRSNWPAASYAPKVTVRVAAFDHAGNFSGWSAAHTQPLPVAVACLCQTALPTNSALPVAFVVLLAVLFRRR
ncbi:MAG: hypothetical protein AB2A00_31880 [Myxococcota bacterium]